MSTLNRREFLAGAAAGLVVAGVAGGWIQPERRARSSQATGQDCEAYRMRRRRGLTVGLQSVALNEFVREPADDRLVGTSRRGTAQPGLLASRQ